MIRTRSQSEAEMSSLKDDDLSPAAESPPVSPQAQIAFSCCTSTSAEYGEKNIVRMTINLSVRDELNSLILRTRREFEVCV